MRTIIAQWMRERGLLRWQPAPTRPGLNPFCPLVDPELHPDERFVQCARCSVPVCVAERPGGMCVRCADDLAASLVPCATCEVVVPADDLLHRFGHDREIGQCVGCVAANRLLSDRVRPAGPPTRIIRRPARPMAPAAVAVDVAPRVYRAVFDRIGHHYLTGVGAERRALSVDVTVDETVAEPVMVQVREQIAAFAARYAGCHPDVYVLVDSTTGLDYIDGCTGTLHDEFGDEIGGFSLTAQAAS